MLGSVVQLLSVSALQICHSFQSKIDLGDPIPMETLKMRHNCGQTHGFIVYQAAIKIGKQLKIAGNIRDRGQVVHLLSSHKLTLGGHIGVSLPVCWSDGNSLPLHISDIISPRETNHEMWMHHTPKPKVCRITKVGHHNIIFTLDRRGKW